MKTPISFINKSECLNAAKKLRAWAEMDGFESEFHTVIPDQCNNAADCFENYAEKGGGYYSNIIKYPFFSNNEIEAILNIF